jgi:multidrug efflux pump subunit AcrB
MNKLIAFFARQHVFPELLTVLIIVGGLTTLFNIRRESFPNVNFDIIVVSTIYAGASPSEVELLINSPLEEKLREVKGIKKMFSVAIESRGEIILQLDPDQTNSDEAKEDIQQIIDRFTELPEDAEDPVALVIESKITPVIEVTVSSDKEEISLKQIAKKVEALVEDIPQVAQVDILGDKKYEYRIEVDLKKLRSLDVSLAEILLALKEQNVTIPGGDYPILEDGVQKDVVVRTTGEFQNQKDIENLVIRTNDVGRSVYLKDLSRITFRLAEPTLAYKAFGKDALRLIVKKKEKADAITLVDRLKTLITEIETKAEYKDVKFGFLNDTSYYIRNRLNILSSNLLMGLVLVLIVLSLFMPFRIAVMVSMGIPVSFLGTIWVFGVYDYSLNLLSVMGLIIVVGMLVDDAVVVTENSVRLMEEGVPPEEAAIRGTQEIWKAVFASVLTTVLAFYPMMTMSGIFGKFVKFIPFAVIVALLISLMEAYFILPSHFARYAKPIDKTKIPKFKQKIESWWQKFTNQYADLLSRVVSPRGRYITLASFFLLLILSVFIAKSYLKFILFPPDGIEVFLVKAEAPKGSSLEQTKKLMEPVESIIQKLPKEEMLNYVMTVGEHRTRDDGADTKRGSHYGQFIVFLTPETDRSRVANVIIEDLKSKVQSQKDQIHKDLVVTFDRVIPGPPVGKPISIGVRGENMEDIKMALTEVSKAVSQFPGAKDITTNMSDGKKEKLLHINNEEASLAGLSAQTIGTSVRAAFEGIVPSTMRKLDEEIDLRVVLKEEQKSVDVLSQLEIVNPRGVLVPLKQVVTIEDTVGLESIFHESGRRQFSVLGDIDTKVSSAQEIVAKTKEWLKQQQGRFPNVSFHFGGENEDTDESLASLKRTFLLALMLIYFLLILTFGNFYQPFLIILAIPLGVISIIWTLAVHGKPLSFMATLGVVALAGVIVNNAIVFIDFINEGRGRGIDLQKAIVDAGKIRLRAVFLTTITTVLGLLPTAYGIGGLDKFVVPIALSLGWGLFLGSIMTMIYIPAFVMVAEDIRPLTLQFFKKLFNRQRS